LEGAETFRGTMNVYIRDANRIVRARVKHPYGGGQKVRGVVIYRVSEGRCHRLMEYRHLPNGEGHDEHSEVGGGVG
jgi:hypothetical protein